MRSNDFRCITPSASEPEETYLSYNSSQIDMGNCLGSQGKTVRIVKTDGKILQYRAAIRVSEALSAFRGHALSDLLPVQQYLEADSELVGGHLYYLIPLPDPQPKVERKKVRFSEPKVAEEGREGEKTSSRVRLVINKQELKEIIENGVISIEIIVPNLHQAESEPEELWFRHHGSQAWKPALTSIPELD
ncbi:hypothetical protein Cgig2_032661 [Carnegiea gigantea]|uniref:Uncharacterized protein n=1 Tax=Carnegiea gigantea TaxID=171969 RepID=A0A9Q1K0X2_9CARY|nr:hypothetical protein Cgig2_032661 [Carnegiea gigantea]